MKKKLYALIGLGMILLSFAGVFLGVMIGKTINGSLNAPNTNDKDVDNRSIAEISMEKIHAEREGASEIAWNVAKEQILARLIAPATAVFPDYNPTYVLRLEDDDDGYIVTGYVDSNNAFGAQIRQTFIVKYNHKPRSVESVFF